LFAPQKSIKVLEELVISNFPPTPHIDAFMFLSEQIITFWNSAILMLCHLKLQDIYYNKLVQLISTSRSVVFWHHGIENKTFNPSATAL